MTIFEFAEKLNGRERGNELTPFEEQRAKELGFVVVFGYSDDNAEFRGAYEDEVECYDGGRVYENGDKYIDAVWCDGEFTWNYSTNIPYATFDIYDGEEKYCKGIVFEEKSSDMTDAEENQVIEIFEEFVRRTRGTISISGQQKVYFDDLVKETMNRLKVKA